MRIYRHWLSLVLLTGCAGIERDCQSARVEAFAAETIVVQFDLNGRPFHCWDLNGIAVTNEPASDGIYWRDSLGNLVHISGQYNYVQIVGGATNSAYTTLGLTRAECEAVNLRNIR